MRIRVNPLLGKGLHSLAPPAIARLLDVVLDRHIEVVFELLQLLEVTFLCFDWRVDVFIVSLHEGESVDEEHVELVSIQF